MMSRCRQGVLPLLVPAFGMVVFQQRLPSGRNTFLE